VQSVSGNEEFLKEKAKLLIARERELLTLKRKHRRLSLWLTLAQRLSELVDPKMDLGQALQRVSDVMVSILDLQVVAFFEVDGHALRPLARTGSTEGASGRLEAPAIVLLTSDLAGACEAPAGPAERALGHAVGLHRFLRVRMNAVGAQPLLFVAGYDAGRAPFYAPFDDEDVSHFKNTADHLVLLLGHNNMVRELETDRSRLQEFNATLERRVDERTHDLAAAAAELLGAFEQLREKDRRLDADIEEARLFQQALLAGGAPASGQVDVATAYLPLERVGGDVFDVSEMAPGRLRIFLADATGHGVQAAMRTIVLKMEYERLKRSFEAPHALLEELARRLHGLFPGGETLCSGCCLDVVVRPDGSADVVYANAANTPIVLFSGEGAKELYGDTPFLGVGELTWPEPVVFRMAPGDALLVASDGLAEQHDERGERFEPSLKEARLANAGSAKECVDRLLRAWEAFRGLKPIADDVTLVVCRVPLVVSPSQGADDSTTSRNGRR
jgi:serine phosphatase RsbU (regulator of sigma subunit)